MAHKKPALSVYSAHAPHPEDDARDEAKSGDRYPITLGVARRTRRSGGTSIATSSFDEQGKAIGIVESMVPPSRLRKPDGGSVRGHWYITLASNSGGLKDVLKNLASVGRR